LYYCVKLRSLSAATTIDCNRLEPLFCRTTLHLSILTLFFSLSQYLNPRHRPTSTPDDAGIIAGRTKSEHQEMKRKCEEEERTKS
jgi:hypothetical protein